MALPKKVLKSFILYCKNFGRFYFRTLFCLKLNSSEIFLQVMYLRAGHLLAVGGVVGGGGVAILLSQQAVNPVSCAVNFV